MFKLGNKKKRLPNNEEIEEELVIDEEGRDEFGLPINPLSQPTSQLATTQQAPQPTQQQPQPVIRQQGLTDLRTYIDELSRRIEEVMSIKNDLEKLTQLRPTIENYINTLNEMVKALTEIENQLNRLEELRRRL